MQGNMSQKQQGANRPVPYYRPGTDSPLANRARKIKGGKSGFTVQR
jgi:hypothetical protein